MGISMTYIPLPQDEEGNQKKVLVSDHTIKQLLISIDTTLKKIECHLSLATDTTLNDQDV